MDFIVGNRQCFPRVQMLDQSVCFSHSIKSFKKPMTIQAPDMGK